MPESIESTTRSITKASVLRFTLIGIIVITPALTPGMCMSFSAIALRQLNLNLDQSSWFTSLMSLATPFGNLFTGCIIDRCGRRTSLILSVIPSIIGWFLLSIRNATIPTLYTGRLLTGFALGMTSLPSTIYAAECIASNNLKIRGSLATWTTLALSIGTLLTYVLGALFSYAQVALIACFVSLASLLLIISFIPESPVWLYRKGRIGDALYAQKRLGIAQPILSSVVAATTTATTTTKRERSACHEMEYIDEDGGTAIYSIRSLTEFIGKLKRKEVYKPLVITVGFLFFMQFSGIYALTSYMVDTIEVSSIKFNPYVLAVISGAIQCMGVMSITFIIPYSGVKNLSIVSSAGVAVGMFTLATTVMCANASSPFLDWLHVASVWFIILAASLGFIVVPYSIIGEIFPMGAKSYASLSLIASSVFNFIVLKLHSILIFYYGALTYFVYGIMAFSGSVFVALFLPETVGKTLEEIKNEFKHPPSEFNDIK